MLQAVVEEKLSLATFEPNRSYPPYLNTPRSLEACRMNGVNPIELVEVPINEFLKDFPNDPDAAQRRYERIDGARRRILEACYKDWKILCDSDWKPNRTRSKSAKERILEVPEGSHCTLLEIQAERFRKLEKDNYEYLERVLRLELKKADTEIRNKRIVAKHNEIGDNNEALRAERRAKKDAAMAELIARQRKKEEDLQADIKAAQAIESEYSRKAIEDKVKKDLRDKQAREKFIADQVKREEYTRQMKDAIVHNIENKINNRKKILELRDKQMADRKREENEIFEKQKVQRRKEEEERMRKAKEDAYQKAEDERQMLLQKMEEGENYRKMINDARDKKRREQLKSNEDATSEKMKKIKETNENLINEKAQKTLTDLEMKEELARQERERIREAQEKRRTIKSIKQEAFQIASMRAKKIADYKMSKMQKDIHDKEIRSNAIKKGFQVLKQMRNSMKDIMNVTTSNLKEEIHKLKHHDILDPDRVAQKAMKVSNEVLFPRLQNIFGIEKPKESLFKDSGDIFAFDFKDPSALDKVEDFLNSNNNEPNEHHNEHKSPSRKLDKTITQFDKPNLPLARSNFATLQITSLTQERISTALEHSKQQLKEANPSPPPTPMKRNDDDDYFSEDEDIPIQKTKKSPPKKQSGVIKLEKIKKENNKRASTAPSNLSSSPLSKPKQSNSPTNSQNDDMDLPIFPFDPLKERSTDEENDASLKRNENDESAKSLNSKISANNSVKVKKIRTDVNDKAKFLEPPKGKFRREFSNDHPLAEGGSGKYKSEIKKGITPTGLPPDVVKIYGSSNSVKSAIDMADKIEKLTYAAENKLVDPQQELEKLRKQQNEILRKILDEERKAEEDRIVMGNSVKDEFEREKLDKIFSEERKRANDRIIAATKNHETVIKQAVLSMMNLGNTTFKVSKSIN